MRFFRSVAAVMLPVVFALGIVRTGAFAPSNDAFLRTWQRTDKPVADGVIARTWMWGPEANTPQRYEEYEEAPTGVRIVQYYDKSRMEITNPDADPSLLWYVTNGLLSKELITGYMQTGDNTYVTKPPAQVNVAGDNDDPAGPTYATFTSLLAAGAAENNAVLTRRVDRAGTLTDDPALAAYGVTAAYRLTTPGIDHQVASVFWDFMTSSGVVYEGGANVTAPLFPNAFYATGFPVTEAYWADVKVAGTYRLVLMQCFERRCLTYTPGNPPGFQTEAGNVGQHYYTWRYGGSPPTPGGAILFETNRDFDAEVYVMEADGSNPQNVTNYHDADDYNYSAWSHDGRLIAFSSYRDDSQEIYVMNADGTEQRRLTENDAFDVQPSWSPDGTRIAFASDRDGNFEIYVMNADGSEQHNLTNHSGDDSQPNWSPDGASIVFATDRDGNLQIYAMDVGGSNPLNLSQNDFEDSEPAWSPDSASLAFTSDRDDGIGDIFVMDADGSNPRQITDGPAYDGHATWSPDGAQLAFEANRDGNAEIYVVSADGSDPHNLTTNPARDVAPAWSPVEATPATSPDARSNPGRGSPARPRTAALSGDT